MPQNQSTSWRPSQRRPRRGGQPTTTSTRTCSADSRTPRDAGSTAYLTIEREPSGPKSPRMSRATGPEAEWRASARSPMREATAPQGDFLDGTRSRPTELYLTVGGYSDVAWRSDDTGSRLTTKGFCRSARQGRLLASETYPWRWDTDGSGARWRHRRQKPMSEAVAASVPALGRYRGGKSCRHGRRTACPARCAEPKPPVPRGRCIKYVEIPVERGPSSLRYFCGKGGDESVWMCAAACAASVLALYPLKPGECT